MTSITKTFLIEADRQNSLEAQAYGLNTNTNKENNAEWVNILKNVNLKKGDILSLENAVINARGSDQNTIEFTGKGINEAIPYTDNFCLFKFWRYINHGSVNTVGLPATCFNDGKTDEIKATFDDNIYQVGSQGTNCSYGCLTDTGNIFVYRDNDGNVVNGIWGAPKGGPEDDEVAGWALQSTNWKANCDSAKYAIIDFSWDGWMRDDDGVFRLTKIKMSEGQFALKVSEGFDSAPNVADNITQTFHQTKPSWVNGKAVGNYVVPTFLNMLGKNVPLAYENGESAVSIPANGFTNQLVDQGIDADASTKKGKPFYMCMAVKEPYRYYYGMKVFTETTNFDLYKDIAGNDDDDYDNPGGKEYHTYYPIYTFNTLPTDVAPVMWDKNKRYSPHQEVDGDYTITGCTFQNVGGTNFTFTRVATNTWGGNSYNFVITPDDGGDDQYASFNGKEGTWFRGTTIDNYSFTFELDTGAGTGVGQAELIGFIQLPDYDENTWTNNDNSANRTWVEDNTSGAGAQYKITSTDDGTYERYVKYQADRPNYLTMYDSDGVTQIGTYGLFTQTGDGEIIWYGMPSASEYSLDGAVFGGNYYEYSEGTINTQSYNYKVRDTDIAGEVLWYLDYDKTLDNPGGNRYTTGGSLSHTLYITYTDGTSTSNKINYITDTELCENSSIWNFEPLAGTLPGWEFSGSSLDFNNGELATGVLQSSTGGNASIKCLFAFEALTGNNYTVTATRDDANVSPIYLRTKDSAGNNIASTWGDGSSSSGFSLANGATTTFNPNSTNCGMIEITLNSTEQLSNFSVERVTAPLNTLSTFDLDSGSITETPTSIDDVWNADGLIQVNLNSPIDENPYVLRSGTLVEISNVFADLPRSHIIPTNIEYTDENMKLVADFLKRTEQYDGVEEDELKIFNDNDLWKTQIDLGRTNDNLSDLEDPDQYGAGTYIGLMEAYKPDRDITHLGTINTCPRLITSSKKEQRPFVYSRYKKGAQDRLFYKGRDIAKANFLLPTNQEADDGSDVARYNPINLYDPTTNTGDKEYDDSLSQKYGVGAYPYYYSYVNTEPGGGSELTWVTKRCICFEMYSEDWDLPQTDYYKIMWGTGAVFSPQLADHPHVFIINGDATDVSQYSSDPVVYPTPNDIAKFCNNVNVGANNMTLNYNINLNRFTFSDFHTPAFLNANDGADAQIGQMCAKYFNKTQYLTGWDANNVPNMVNPFLWDSQTGCFLHDIFFQSESSRDITSSDDSRAIMMTYDNFYGSMWWKMGFKYFQLKPMRFNNRPFNNRYAPFYYNNYSKNAREYLLSFMTTNSSVSISAYPQLNKVPLNLKEFGQPQLFLGYNNVQSANVITTSSEIVANDLNVQLDNGYYRIYTDLPLDTLNYNANSQELPCLGICLRNYTQKGFFFGYSTSYSIQISRDTPLNSIKTIIRSPDGRISANLDKKCCVFYKIQRVIDINKQPDPVVEELKDIKGVLSKGYKEEEQRDDEQIRLLKDIEVGEGVDVPLENIEEQQLVAPPREVRQPTLGEIQIPQSTSIKRTNQLNQLKIQIQMDILRRLLATYPLDLVVRKNKPEEEIIKLVSRGVAEVFVKNRKVINDFMGRIYNATTPKEQGEIKNELLDFMSGFNLNEEGRLTDEKPRQFRPDLIMRIDDKGLLNLVQRADDFLDLNKGSEEDLIRQLNIMVSNILVEYLQSNTMTINDNPKMTKQIFQKSKSRFKTEQRLARERIQDDPLAESFKKDLDISGKAYNQLVQDKQARGLLDLYRKFNTATTDEERSKIYRTIADELRERNLDIRPMEEIKNVKLPPNKTRQEVMREQRKDVE